MRHDNSPHRDDWCLATIFNYQAVTSSRLDDRQDRRRCGRADAAAADKRGLQSSDGRWLVASYQGCCELTNVARRTVRPWSEQPTFPDVSARRVDTSAPKLPLDRMIG